MDIYGLNVTGQQIDAVVRGNRIGQDIEFEFTGDYSCWVIKLVPVDEGEYFTFSGEMLIIRDNSIYAPTHVILNMAKVWAQAICRCNNLVISHEAGSSSLCTFMYNGKKYYGFHWWGAANPTIKYIRAKVSNVPIEQIVYKDASGVINAEIAESVTNINWDGSPK